MLKVINKNISNIIGDIIIPGNGNEWICFSKVINIEKYIEIDVDDMEVCALDFYQERISTIGVDLTAETAAFEASEPVLFAKIYRSFVDAYYSAPAVVARVERLADQSPKEANAVFDETLLTNVLAREAGRRRL